jgi:hypothetical protein
MVVTTDADAKQIILNPYRATLCDGEQHYTIPRSGEEFTNIKEASFIFHREILSQRAQKRDISLDVWNAMVSKPSILLEFKVPIPQDVIKWAVDNYSASSSAPNDVQKLLILPKDGSNVGLYVQSSSNEVFYYTSNEISTPVMENYYSGALTAINLDDANVIKYATIYEFGADSFPGFSGDVMGNIYGKRSTMFRNFKYEVPFSHRGPEIANTVLGDDINSYSRSSEVGGDLLLFKNFSNLYRVHSDGIMEYSYIPTANAQDKGDIYSALSNAMGFVLKIKTNLLDEPELYLSGMSQDDASYQFTFDYIHFDFPVYFSHKATRMGEVIVQSNAVVIQSNGKRVISCRWALVDIYRGTEIRNLQTAFDTIDAANIFSMSVSDISIAYHFDMNSDREQAGSADRSDKGAADRPDQGSTGRPDQGNAGRPDQGNEGRPDQGSTGMSDQGNAGRPDQGNAGRPAWPEWRIEDPERGAFIIPMREGKDTATSTSTSG